MLASKRSEESGGTGPDARRRSLQLTVGRKEDATMAKLTNCTLLDLVQTISDYATSDAEVVATVAFLINSGTVRLCGTFAGARIDLVPEAGAAPPFSLLQHHRRDFAGRFSSSYSSERGGER